MGFIIADQIKNCEANYNDLVRKFSTCEKGHGRLEMRDISVISVKDIHPDFKSIKQIARLETRTEKLKDGKVTTEVMYLITNLSSEEATAEELLKLKRGYWRIENQLHYVKDFVFGEDRSTIRAGNGPDNMNSIRNFCIGLLRCCGIENIERCVDELGLNVSKLVAGIFRRPVVA